MIKSKIILLVVSIFIFASCKTNKNLPKYTEIDIHRFGSFIELNYRSDEHLAGELIAVEKDSIVVLNDENNSCLKVAKAQIHNYYVRFANPKHYGYFIPLLMLSTISHGYFSIITLPANLIGTIVIASTGESAYKMDQKELSYEQMKMYARFPQGVPEGIPIEKIKN